MRDPEEVGRAVLANLAVHRERRHAESQALRAVIAALATADDGPSWGRASRIRARLSAPRPSLRTVRWHLQAFFKEVASAYYLDQLGKRQ